MRQLSTTIEIEAPPEKVWAVLMDFAGHAEWNPFMRSIQGKAEAGARLTVRLQPPKGMGMTFKPTVLAKEPNREFRWIGHLGVPGIFDGDHRFLVESAGDGRTRFTQSERFTGVLTPVLAIFGLFRNTHAGFEAMNRALKERVEQGAG